MTNIQKTTIQNRYDFLYLFDCENGNPNGDPDADNSPRIDPEDMHGLVSDVAIKRRVRNYIQTIFDGDDAGTNAIFIKHATNLNKIIAQTYEKLFPSGQSEGTDKRKSKNTSNVSDEASDDTDENAESGDSDSTLAQVESAREWMCKNFYDVRTFGAVMSTGANAGQVRGPVQVAFSRSVDPILPMYLTITRMAVAKNPDSGRTVSAYEAWENAQPAKDLQGTMGKKSIIPYGLYVCKGFVSAHLAKGTGFTEDDLGYFWDALANMWDYDRSASKGVMSCRGLYIFKHVGTDSNETQRVRQAMLGCAPAHRLLDISTPDSPIENTVIKINHREELPGVPRSFSDYVVNIDKTLIPRGVELIEYC